MSTLLRTRGRRARARFELAALAAELRAEGREHPTPAYQAFLALWPGPYGQTRPAWARISYEQGWMSLAAFLRVPTEPGRFRQLRRVYKKDLPYFASLRKNARTSRDERIIAIR